MANEPSAVGMIILTGMTIAAVVGLYAYDVIPRRDGIESNTSIAWPTWRSTEPAQTAQPQQPAYSSPNDQQQQYPQQQGGYSPPQQTDEQNQQPAQYPPDDQGGQVPDDQQGSEGGAGQPPPPDYTQRR